MKRDCSTCICKEGSCYPSKTIFDKDKTCKSYDPDYEGYIADLENTNAELKGRNRELLESCEGATIMYKHLTKAKELLKQWLQANICDSVVLFSDTEQFLSEVEK